MVLPLVALVAALPWTVDLVGKADRAEIIVCERHGHRLKCVSVESFLKVYEDSREEKAERKRAKEKSEAEEYSL